MFQIKLREHPALESGCRVSGAVEGVFEKDDSINSMKSRESKNKG